MTQLYREHMSTPQKSAYINEHGPEAFMALPTAPPAKYKTATSLVDLVPREVEEEFIQERGPTGQRDWDLMCARAQRPW